MFSRAILYILVLLAAIGCSNPLEKSVLDPLTSNELDKVAGEDNSFLATYSIVEEKWNYINNSSDSTRWSPLTYGRLHSYIKSIESAETNSPLLATLSERWNVINNNNKAKADSLIAFWCDFYSANHPDSIVKVVFSGIETEKIRNMKKQLDTLVKSKISLKSTFPIDSLSFSYTFLCNSDSTYVSDSTQYNYVNYTRKLQDSTILKLYPSLNSHIKRLLVEGDSSVVFQYKLHSVYSDVMCHNEDSIRTTIPACILKYLDNKFSTDSLLNTNTDILKMDIIKELVDSNFISKIAYLRINAQEYYRQTDSLAFNYLLFRGDL